MSDSTKFSLARMRKAASAFVDKLETRDKALIIAFDKNIHPVMGPTSDKDILRLALDSILGGGGTALYDTVFHVASKSFKEVGGRKAVILLTDGIDTASAKATFETSMTIVAQGNTAFFPIQYEPENLRTAPASPGG